MITLTGVLFDEVALMPESFFNQAIARCSVDNSKLWLNCNPDQPEHYIKKEWIDKAKERNALHLHFLMEDNPSLSKNILTRYEKMFSGVFYSRYILGEWVVAQGLIWGCFDKKKHLKELPENTVYSQYIISMDYGIQNPTAMILWGKYNKKWYAIKEYYHSGRDTQKQKTDEQYYKKLEKLASNTPCNEVIVDPSASSFIVLIRQKKRFKVRKASNDVIAGIQAVSECFLKEKIYISKKCKNTIKELGLYRWDEKSEIDRPIKESDHCITGDTLISTEKGDIPIKDLVGKKGNVWSYNIHTEKAELKPFSDVRITRKKAQIYRLYLENGKHIDCTEDHLILTDKGYKELKYLDKTDKIIDIKSIQKGAKIAKINRLDKQDVYNMEVEGNHNFAVNNGIIVHNCMDALRYFVFTKKIHKQERKINISPEYL